MKIFEVCLRNEGFSVLFVLILQVSDDILHQKPNVESCYIAAQTMRSKIQTRFHEVPADAHVSLRDSLVNHLLNVDEQVIHMFP